MGRYNKIALSSTSRQRLLFLLLPLNFLFIGSFSPTVWADGVDDPTSASSRLSISIMAMEFPGFSEKSAAHPEGIGIAVDMARAVFAAGGVDVQFEIVPIARALEHMLNGKRQVLLGNNYYMPEKVQAKHFKLPLYPVNNVIFYHKKHFNPSAFTLRQAISQHRIVSPYAPKHIYDQSTWVQVVPDAKDVLKVIITGRAPLGALPWLTVRSLLKKNHPSEVENVAFYSPAIMREWPGIVIDKTYDNSDTLIERLKIGYEKIKSDGTRQEVFDRYWPNQSQLDELLALEPASSIGPPDL